MLLRQAKLREVRENSFCLFPPLQNHSEIAMYKTPYCHQNDATLRVLHVQLRKQRRKWLRESQASTEGKDPCAQKPFPDKLHSHFLSLKGQKQI